MSLENRGKNKGLKHKLIAYVSILFLSGCEKMEEQNQTLENYDIGGNMRQWLDVKTIDTECFYTVTDAYIEKAYNKDRTQCFGNRVIFEIESGEDLFKISDWNITTKAKFKANEIKGKTISLKPHNEKRVLLTVV